MDTWSRNELVAEGQDYGMDFPRRMPADAIDRNIQDKVGRDFRAGRCSRCGNPVHTGQGCR